MNDSVGDADVCNIWVNYNFADFTEERLMSMAKSHDYKIVALIANSLKSIQLQKIKFESFQEQCCFLLNIFHAMFLHQLISKANFPLLNSSEREAFMNASFYQFSDCTLSLTELFLLITSLEVINGKKHDVLKHLYMNDAKLHFLISTCCATSPPMTVFTQANIQNLTQLLCR